MFYRTRPEGSPSKGLMKKSVHGTTKISVRIRLWVSLRPTAKAASTLFADVFALSKSYEMRGLQVVSKLSRVCNLSLTNRIDGAKEGKRSRSLESRSHTSDDPRPRQDRRYPPKLPALVAAANRSSDGALTVLYGRVLVAGSSNPFQTDEIVSNE